MNPRTHASTAGRSGVALSVFASIFASIFSPGCQDPETPKPPIGGTGGEPGTSTCASSRVCSGNEVHKCIGGIPGPLIDTCVADLPCSLGRCVSRACADAEREETIKGCLFYAPDIDNVASDDSQTSTVLLANPGSTVATVDLQLREISQPWTTDHWILIPPQSAGSFVLPDRHLEGGGLGSAKAYRIISDVPITATLIESDDRTESARSTGGTVLVPAHALGASYMVMTYPQVATSQIVVTSGGRRGAGQVVIVATDEDTTVSFKVSSTAFVGPEGGAPLTPPGQVFNLLLQDGDIYQVFTSSDFDDLSGSVITANKPIAVFSGNITTMYGRGTEGVHSPDLAVEQMIPKAAWGRSYVAARLGPQEATCDSIFSGNSALWRILAAENDTQVSFMAPPGVGGLPTGLTLNAGAVTEFLVSSAGSFVVNASKPILVTQAMDCEGTLSPGVVTSPMLKEYLFALPANFDHEAIIVRGDATPIYLDDRLVNDSLFLPAGANFAAARVHIPPCVGEADRCLHKIEGLFGVTLRGMDVVCGYAMTPQPWVRCVGPDIAGCVR